MDNRKDIQDWNEEHELKKLGVAYAQADAEFLGLEKKTAPEPLYCVQVGAFRDPENAGNMLDKLKTAGFDGFVTKHKG